MIRLFYPGGYPRFDGTWGFPTFQTGEAPSCFFNERNSTNMYKLQTVKAPKISKGLRLKYLILNF
jgi:hypothetical protein